MSFDQNARDAGFSLKQIDFFREWFAQIGHNHTVDDIVGLDQVVEEMVETNMEDEEGEEE